MKEMTQGCPPFDAWLLLRRLKLYASIEGDENALCKNVNRMVIWDAMLKVDGERRWSR